MKKSLLISDEDRYGKSSPAVAMPSGPSGKPKKAPKSGVSITLYGPQAEAFCGDGDCKVGDKGSATVHYVVKGIRAGEDYGSEVPSGDGKPRQITLILTHVEADSADGSSGKSDDDSNEEDQETDDDSSAEDESGADAGDESDGEDADPAPSTPAKGGIGRKAAPLSVSDTGLDSD